MLSRTGSNLVFRGVKGASGHDPQGVWRQDELIEPDSDYERSESLIEELVDE
jgi:hypothetical protein